MSHLGHIKLAVAIAAGALVVAPPAHAAGRPAVAALQVTLRHHHVYKGPVDGIVGRQTTAAVMRFQRRHGLTPDGVAGPKTRRAFGRFAKHVLGSRILLRGMAGWDVAELQFALAWHGFPNAAIDGGFGGHVKRALIKFQRWAHLTPDGIAGPGTFRALRAPLPRCPIALAWPLRAPVGSPFGPRGIAFHPGIDLPGAMGTPVGAAAPGLPTTRAATATSSKSITVAVWSRCTRTSQPSRSASARPSRRERESAGSARAASRQGRTCTSRFESAEPRSTPSRP